MQYEYIELVPLDSQRLPNSLEDKDRILGYKDALGDYHRLPCDDSFGVLRLAAYGMLKDYEPTCQTNIMRRPISTTTA